MMPVPLRLARVLDPRPAPVARQRPIADSVNIPLDELPARMHELPPRDDTLLIAADGDLASQAIALLAAAGRRAQAASPDELAPAPGTLIGDDPHTAIPRLWRPTAFLEEVAPQLTPGAALELACGSGRDAVYLASLGWRVTAIDVLPDALALGRDLERRYAPGAHPIEWGSLDLERPPLALPRAVRLVTIFRFLSRPLIAELRAGLTPGASVLCETFTEAHRERWGKPGRSHLVLQSGELRTLFDGWDVRHVSEAWRGRAHTARVWALCPGSHP